MATPLAGTASTTSSGFRQSRAADLRRINTDVVLSDSESSAGPPSPDPSSRQGMTKRSAAAESSPTFITTNRFSTATNGGGGEFHPQTTTANPYEHMNGNSTSSDPNPPSPVPTSAEFPHSRPAPRISSPTLSRRHSPLLPGFGHSFPSSSKSSRGVFGLGPPSKRLLPRILQSRNPNRNRLLAAIVLVVLVLWTVYGGSKGGIVKERLTTRWWDADSNDKPPALLPRPSMIPKPARPKPPTLSSHSLAVLARLPTTFSATTPPPWTAVIHLTSTSQLSPLSKLIKSILRQSAPPTSVIILAPEGLSPDPKKHGPLVSLLQYPPTRPAALALILASSSVTTPHMVIIDAQLDVMKSSYVRTLLRASGTKEYGSALLSAGGLVLPISSSSRLATCLVSDGSPDSLDRTAAIHAPSTPFLIQTEWLTPLSNGLRTDLPLEVGIALALWTKSGIPSFGIPVPWDEGRRDFGCERLRRNVAGSEAKLGLLFRRVKSSARTGPVASETKEGGAEGDEIQQDGTVVILLSGDDELELAHQLACGFAQEQDLRVYVADSESAAQGPHVFFPTSTSDATSGGTRCHLDIHPLGTGAPGESIQLAVIAELRKIGKVELAIYVGDGARGREFGEVMKWSEGQFGVRMGGKRRSRARVEQEGGLVAIPLLKEDVVHSEWMSALPMEALRHWHVPKIDITVITNDRPASLHRLLTALQDAHYFGDEISLSINLEQTADRLTQRLVDDFSWDFGTVTLRHRIILGGLMPAIVESWYPASNDTYGVFLEDDVEVSPMFYSWLKFTILQYRYYTPMRERSSRLFGVSLYQQRNIELRPEGRQPFDAHKLFFSLSMPSTLPYLSQIPCSWGAAYFPEVWREFHAYLALRLSETALPISDTIVPEIRSNKWPRSWKKYFIELVYMRGYVMLYPNYADFASFSNNHLEKGTHIHVSAVDEKRKRQFDVPLMDRNGSILDLPEGRLPPWDALPVIDLWGALASDDDLIERGWQSVAQLDTCPPFRLDIPPTHNARELLCAKVYERTNVLVEAQPLQATASPAQGDAEAPKAAFERPALVEHPNRGAGEEVDEAQRDGTKPEELERLRAYEQRVQQRVGGGERDARGVLDGEDDGSLVRLEEDDSVGVVADVPSGEEAAEIERKEE